MASTSFSGILWDEDEDDNFNMGEEDRLDEELFNEEYQLQEEEEVEQEPEVEEIDEEEAERGEEAKANAEVEIEGDFNRLLSGMRDRPLGEGRDEAEWNFVIDEDPNIDFHDELRAASRVGRRKGKGRRHTRQKPLSPEVHKSLGEAMLSYVNQSYDSAIPLLREVIRIEPNEHSAWSMLAKCHDELGDKNQALTLEIMAAHLTEPEKAIWRDLGRRSRDAGYMQQAIYCFRKIISIDPKDVDALWDRSFLLKETGYLRNALTGFQQILAIYPHTPEVLEQLRFILVELNDIPTAISLYQSAFNFYTTSIPTPTSYDSPEFGARHIMALADCYNGINDPSSAIRTIRNGARWLQGRAQKEKWWENVGDDREFDVPGFARGGGASVAGGDGAGEMAQGFYDLDLNLRHRLAVARLKLGDEDEGKMHASIILANDVLEYSVLFNELADAYFERGMNEEALEVYQELAEHEETSNFHILLQIGLCHRNLSNFDSAIEVYQIAIAADPSNTDVKMKLAEIYEMTNQSRKALELVQEVIETRRAQARQAFPPHSRTLTQTQDATSPNEASLIPERKALPSSGKKEKSARLTTHQLAELEKQREEETKASFERMDQLEEEMEMEADKEKVDEWLREANGISESFRGTRQLFPGNRYAQFRGVLPHRFLNSKAFLKDAENREKDMATRLQLDLAEDNRKKTGKEAVLTVFRGIPFATWLRMFTKYAMVLTQEGQYRLSDEILRHILLSNAFVDFTSQTTIRLALLACAVHEKDYKGTLEHCRRLMRTNQFNNDAVRLLFAAHAGSGLYGTESLLDTKLQKANLRELRLYESLSHGKPLKWKSAFGRYVIDNAGGKGGDDDSDAEEEGDGKPGPKGTWLASVGENPNPVKATKESPVLIATSGLTNLCGRNFQGAIYYLLKTYEVHADDPLICLSLAVACVSRAMQRQVDNRHHMVVEALAFLDRYRTLRSATDDLADEVEFNFGRLFHQLGLNTLAVKHYEAVLDIVSKRMAENGATTKDFGLAREAAFNLSLIYVTVGAPDLAQALYRRWLSL